MRRARDGPLVHPRRKGEIGRVSSQLVEFETKLRASAVGRHVALAAGDVLPEDPAGHAPVVLASQPASSKLNSSCASTRSDGFDVNRYTWIEWSNPRVVVEVGRTSGAQWGQHG